jgi:hypothetical protein
MKAPAFSVSISIVQPVGMTSKVVGWTGVMANE